MRVLLLYNPRAGAGRATGVAAALARDVAAAGHEVHRLESRLEPATGWLDPALVGADALVVLGGDGAVRMCLASAVRSGTPLFHYPQGTENLFARQFDMRATPSCLLGALERGAVEHVDVGRAGTHWFVLMVSVGCDADVVHDLSARRGARISHASYIMPIVRRLWRFATPPITIRADGQTIVEDRIGIAVVGNSRQYALRMDPAAKASMTDGQLDVVFMPAATRHAAIRWLIACRRGRHLNDPRLVYHRATDIELSSPCARAYQIDGDPPEPPDPPAPADAGWSLRVGLAEGRLAVLLA